MSTGQATKEDTSLLRLSLALSFITAFSPSRTLVPKFQRLALALSAHLFTFRYLHHSGLLDLDFIMTHDDTIVNQSFRLCSHSKIQLASDFSS